MDAKLSHKVKEAAIVPLDLCLCFGGGHIRQEGFLVIHGGWLMVGEIVDFVKGGRTLSDRREAQASRVGGATSSRLPDTW